MSASYSFVHVEKIKTSGAMINKTDHNLRRKDRENIIKELSSLNREYVSLNDSIEVTDDTVKDYMNRKGCKIKDTEKGIKISSSNVRLMSKLYKELKMNLDCNITQTATDLKGNKKMYNLSIDSRLSNEVRDIINDYTKRLYMNDLNNEKLTYHDAFCSRIANLEYYKNHNVRENAVLGYEVIMTYSKDPNIDPYKWAEMSMEWLHKAFDKAGDGKSNVLNAVLHMDEPGNPHIHAFVTPIDERGRLNASRYTDGFKALTQLQDGYADAIKSLGIKRGVSGSTANHKKITKMYAELNNMTDVPKPLENENAIDYYNRIQGHVETVLAVNVRQKNLEVSQAHRENGETFSKMRELIADELNETRLIIKKEKRQAETELEDIKGNISNYKEQLTSLQTQYNELMHMYENKVNESEEYDKFIKYREGLDALKNNEPVMFEEAIESYNYVIDAADKDYNINIEK